MENKDCGATRGGKRIQVSLVISLINWTSTRSEYEEASGCHEAKEDLRILILEMRITFLRIMQNLIKMKMMTL